MAYLNPEFVFVRRLECGLSRRALARHLGVSLTIINGIEGSAHDGHLSLTFIGALADALAVDIADLLQPSSESAVPSPQPDDVELEAILASAGRALHRDDLARGMDWSIKRVEAAASALDARLKGTGQTLFRSHVAFIGLCPAAVDASLTNRISMGRSQMSKHGVDIRCARLMTDVLAGRVTEEKPSRSTKTKPITGVPLVKATAVKAGLLRLEDGFLAATDDVLFSLGLSEDRGTPSRQEPASEDRRRHEPRPT